MKKYLNILFVFILILGLCGFVKASPIEMEYENGIYHFTLSGDKIKKQIKFISSQNLITNKEAHTKSGSVLTINTGFFDPKNQKTISYIVNDSQTVEDPLFNDALMTNPILRRNMKKILNRTEFRVIECNNKYSYQIVPHKDSIEFGCNIITSAQGGPMILPELRLEEEFKVLKADPIAAQKTLAVVQLLKGQDQTEQRQVIEHQQKDQTGNRQ